MIPKHSTITADAGEFGSTLPGLARRLNDRGWAAGLWLIALTAFLIQVPSLNRPFLDHHDWSTAHQAQFARNHVRYGLAFTKTRCVYNRHVELFEQARRGYPDHPPLLSLLLASSIAAFGDSDFAVRLVPALASAAAALLTALIAVRFIDRSSALLAGLLMACFPITFHFGHVANHEPVALCFWLIGMWGYLGWLEEAAGRMRRRWAVWMILGMSLSILTGWIGMLVAAAILVHFGLSRRGGRRRDRSWRVPCIAMIPAVIITFGHVFWSMGFNLHELLGVLAYRTGMSDAERGFSFSSWLPRQAEWLWRDFTICGLLLGLVGAAACTVQGVFRVDRTVCVGGGNGWREMFWLLGGPGLVFVVLFRSGSFLHEYWWWHVAPLVAILSAIGLQRLADGARLRRMGGRVAIRGLALAGVGFETWLHRDYFRAPPLQFSRNFHDACRFIRANSDSSATVHGNVNRWVRRHYHDGPVDFLHPTTEWYLDRMWIAVNSEAEMKRAVGIARYYAHLSPPGGPDMARENLLRRFRCLRAWDDVALFDLTQPAEQK